MGAHNTFALSSRDQRALRVYATRLPITEGSTKGLANRAIPALPATVTTQLTPWLGPNGLGYKRHWLGNVPCALNQPAFGAQFVVAYNALAGISPGENSRCSLCSYALKHAVENAWGRAGLPGDVYICNGALILAALAHGYPVSPHPDWGSNNAAVRLGFGWRKVVLNNLSTQAAAGGAAL